MIEFQIDEEDHCRPLSSWLRLRMKDAPGGYVHQLVKKGHVTVNGSAATDLTPLLSGDCIRLKESSRTSSLLTDERPPFDILYEDGWIIVFNKPPGLPMHHAAEVGPDNLVDSATSFIRCREQAAHSDRTITLSLRPINRLDRGTSGAVLLAKSSSAAGMFGRTVMESGLSKLYLAMVNGRLNGSGEITAAVDGKDAATHYESLAATGSSSLVALWPLTGRMHQLRQHLRHIGHPILGDRRYGGPPLPAYAGHLLHAFGTSFIHPDGENPITLFAPLPAGFLRMMRTVAGPSLPAILLQLPELVNRRH
jgi:23S rRNA pseudouridine955/2504/2580 synthase